MLAVNRSLLKRGYNLINVRNALALIVSMCNLHLILVSNYTEILYIINKWDIPSI
jgi:hypothetical protein